MNTILQDVEAGNPSRALRVADKVKVTYVVGSLRDAGAERQVLELIRHLDREIFAPSLIVLEEINLERGIELAVPCSAVGLPQAGNAKWLRRAWPLARSVTRMKKRIRQIQSDVVHGFLPGPCIVSGFAALWTAVPVIVGSRRSLLTHYRGDSRVADWADSAAFHMASFNLGNSLAVRREMVELGRCPAEKCGTIHNGVDLQRFRPGLARELRQRMGWTQQEVVLGMVANFRLCKRHCDFVQAAAHIAQQYPQARFLLAGAEGEAKALVVRQIKTLALTGLVQVIDGVADPENVFAALDIYICTSQSEGFSNVLLEAMACGLPVIATNVGGNAEAVRDGETGFLVPALRPDLVAEAACRLLRDPGLRRSMGNSGRQRVESDFSLPRMVHAHEELYLDLLRRRKPACG